MTPAEQFRALGARKIDLGFVGLQWESITQHRTVVVLPVNHPLVRKRQVKLSELKTMFLWACPRRPTRAFGTGLARLASRPGRNFLSRLSLDALSLCPAAI
jgi:hypothetical protein